MFSFLQKNLVTIFKIPSYINGLKNHRTFLIKRDIDPIDIDIKSFEKNFTTMLINNTMLNMKNGFPMMIKKMK